MAIDPKWAGAWMAANGITGNPDREEAFTNAFGSFLFPQEGESQEAYTARMNAKFDELKSSGKWDQYIAGSAGSMGGAPAAAAATAESRLDDFYKFLNATLTPGSPYHTALVQEARGLGNASAANAGIEGGLADANTAYYGAQAAQMARERLLAGHAQGVGLNVGIANFREGQHQFDAQMRQQAQMMQWQQQQQMGQMVGGGLGALAGGALGFGITGGNPMGAMFGMQAGAGIGGGLGGGFAPPPPGYYGRRGNY